MLVTGKPLKYERPGRAAGPRTQYKSIYFWRWATHILFLRYDFMYVFWVWARRFAIGGSIKACFHILLAVYFNGFPVAAFIQAQLQAIESAVLISTVGAQIKFN